jgi:hypothetical protein
MEIYGAQPPVELMRHLITHNFLYDSDKLFLKHVKDVVVFSAAAPPGGGRAGKKMLAYFGRYYFSF